MLLCEKRRAGRKPTWVVLFGPGSTGVAQYHHQTGISSVLIFVFFIPLWVGRLPTENAETSNGMDNLPSVVLKFRDY